MPGRDGPAEAFGVVEIAGVAARIHKQFLWNASPYDAGSPDPVLFGEHDACAVSCRNARRTNPAGSSSDDEEVRIELLLALDRGRRALKEVGFDKLHGSKSDRGSTAGLQQDTSVLVRAREENPTSARCGGMIPFRTRRWPDLRLRFCKLENAASFARRRDLAAEVLHDP